MKIVFSSGDTTVTYIVKITPNMRLYSQVHAAFRDSLNGSPDRKYFGLQRLFSVTLLQWRCLVQQGHRDVDFPAHRTVQTAHDDNPHKVLARWTLLRVKNSSTPTIR